MAMASAPPVAPGAEACSATCDLGNRPCPQVDSLETAVGERIAMSSTGRRRLGVGDAWASAPASPARRRRRPRPFRLPPNSGGNPAAVPSAQQPRSLSPGLPTTTTSPAVAPGTPRRRVPEPEHIGSFAASPGHHVGERRAIREGVTRRVGSSRAPAAEHGRGDPCEEGKISRPTPARTGRTWRCRT